MRTIPVIPDQPADKQLSSDAIGLGGGESVVDEESVADGFVDYAV